MKKETHTTIKELPPGERPYERFESVGPEALSDAELLAIILRSGVRGENSVDLAKRILSDSQDEKSLLGLYHMSVKDLMKIPGIGKVKAIQLKCITELSKRLSKTDAKKSLIMNTPGTVARYYMEEFRHLEKEKALIILLNAGYKLITDLTLSSGTINQTLISTREVFKEALSHGAVFFMLLHNHPSGDPTPSKEDILMTSTLREAGEIMDIKLIDHIIIGDNKYISIRELGLF